MRKLPYTARTASGDTFDIEFPLHPETQDPVRVNQVLTAVLGAIDRDIALSTDTGNGDVLQAVAMALAIRARIIDIQPEVVETLSGQLLLNALQAMREAKHTKPVVGHA